MGMGRGLFMVVGVGDPKRNGNNSVVGGTLRRGSSFRWVIMSTQFKIQQEYVRLSNQFQTVFSGRDFVLQLSQ